MLAGDTANVGARDFGFGMEPFNHFAADALSSQVSFALKGAD